MTTNPYLGFAQSNPWLGTLLNGAGSALIGLSSNTPAGWAYANNNIQNYNQQRFENKRATAQDAQNQMLFDQQQQDRAQQQARDAAHAAAMAKLFGGPQGPQGQQGQPNQLGWSSQQVQLAQALGPEAQDQLATQTLFPAPDQTEDPAQVKEYKFYQSQGGTMPFYDWQVHRAQAGSNQTTVNLPATESSFQTHLGAAQGDEAAAVPAEGDTARNQMDTLNTIEALRAAAQAAGTDVNALAPIKVKVGAILQAAGLDPKDFDLNGTGVMQAIGAASNKLALSGIGKGGLPANNFSEADRNFITSTVPGIADTPEGFELKALVMRKVASRTLEKEKLWNSGKYNQTTQAGYADFRRDWAKYVAANPLFGEAEKGKARLLQGGNKSPLIQTPQAAPQGPVIVPTLPAGFN